MPQPTSAPRVVVADDSALMRRIVSTLLLRAGMTVVGSASDGDEALALCEREKPDAMTLDLTMPGLDGLGVLRALPFAALDQHPGGGRLRLLGRARRPRRRRARRGRVRPRGQALGPHRDRRLPRQPADEDQAGHRRARPPRRRDQGAHWIRQRRVSSRDPAHQARSCRPRGHLDGRAPRAGRTAAQASRAARPGDDDRPTHAARLYRVAGRPPRPAERAARVRGQRRRAPRSRDSAAGAGRQAPPSQQRRLHAPERRTRGGRSAPARRPADRATPPGCTATASCSSSSPAWATTACAARGGARTAGASSSSPRRAARSTECRAPSPRRPGRRGPEPRPPGRA